MNGNFTQLSFTKSTLASVVLFFLTFFTAAAQPDYDFRDPVLVSGTDRQEGSVYLFENVKPGVDAFVTIVTITNGITLAILDDGSGYPEALQPSLNTKSKKKGYVEMQIDFVYAGTKTPYFQKEVPITCIDVDGMKNTDAKGNDLHEFDQINMGPGSYVNYTMTGFELDVKQTGSWVTGTNIGGIDYPGRDTLATQVMFTVVNANISTATIRVGVDNSTSDVDAYRLRSVYFKKFVYANGLLAASPLRSFNGVNKNSTITFNASFNSANNLRSVQLEKSIGNNTFSIIGEMFSSVAADISFTDNAPAAGTNYYRLKIIAANGEVSYSNLLRFNITESAKQGFKIYPTVIANNTTINITADKTENSAFQLLDLAGRIVYQQGIYLQSGNNVTVLNVLGNINPGNYIAMVKTGNKIYSQQVVKQ
jgi:hypothetical protein